jgi:hypothetical protein
MEDSQSNYTVKQNIFRRYVKNGNSFSHLKISNLKKLYFSVFEHSVIIFRSNSFLEVGNSDFLAKNEIVRQKMATHFHILLQNQT